MSAEPARERVEAYEKALGCSFVPGCLAHHVSSTDCEEAGGCPVAVAAARVEAEKSPKQRRPA